MARSKPYRQRLPSSKADKGNSAWVARLPARNFFRRLCLVKTRTDNDDAAVVPGNEVGAYGLWPALKFDSPKELTEQVGAVGLENTNIVRSKLMVQFCQLARSVGGKASTHAVAYLLGKGGAKESLALLPKTKEGELLDHTYDFCKYVDEMVQGEGHCATEEFQEAFELAMDRMQAATLLGRRGKREKEATPTTVSSRRKTFTTVEHVEGYVSPRKQSKGVATKAFAQEEPEEDEPGEEEAHPEIKSVQFTEQQEAISSPESGVYEGELKNGRQHRKFTYPNGDVYEGEWADSGPNGKGKMKYLDGRRYEGEWLNGMRHGQGKCTYYSGRVYEGEWVTDNRHGKGKMKYASGAVYDGEWLNSKAHGKGTAAYANGEVYEGEWKDGEKHGKGTAKNAPAGAIYDGEWAAGRWQGRGKCTFPNGDRYEGEMVVDGKRHGKGKCTYVAGEVYEGEWREGKRHGKGTHTSTNGDAFTGEWESDKKHGVGILKEASGTEYKQEYSNGELLSSKRIANTADDVPVSQRPRTGEARGMVLLNDNELGCWNCGEDYTFDMNATEDDERNLLPVISSCDHTCCHGCILKWQVARAEMNNRPVAKRVNCMMCKKKSAIRPSEPKYDRRLIDLLGRCSR